MLTPFDASPMGGTDGASTPYAYLPWIDLSYRSISTDFLLQKVENTMYEVDFTPIAVDASISLWHTWYGAFERGLNSSYRTLTKSSDPALSMNATSGGIAGTTVLAPTPFGTRLRMTHCCDSIIINDSYYPLGVESVNFPVLNSPLRINGYYETRNNENELYSGGAGRFYSFRCLVSGQLVLDLVPARRKTDGVEGFWCRVREQFYY